MLDAVIDFLPAPQRCPGRCTASKTPKAASPITRPNPRTRHPFPRARLQDHVRHRSSVQLTFVRVYSGVADASGDLRHERHQRTRSEKHRPHPARCTPTSAKEVKELVRGQHRRRGRRPQGDLHHGRHALRPTGRAGRCSSRMEFPEPVIETRRSSPRPRPTTRRWAWRCRRLASEDPSFRVSPRTKRPARRSSRAWASCTWRSSSTA